MHRSRDSRRRDRGRSSGSSRSRSGQRHSSGSSADSERQRSSRSPRNRRRSRSGDSRRRRSHERRSRSRGSTHRRRSSRGRSRSRSSEKDSRGKRDKRRSMKHRYAKLTDRDSEEKIKDTVKKIEAMKSQMRSALDSVQTDLVENVEGLGTSNAPSYSVMMDLTVTETVARHRDIKRIEEESFVQSTFISSAGGAGGRIKNEDLSDRMAMMDKKQDAHDKAMFGPKWRDAETVKKFDENGQNETMTDYEKQKDIPLANVRFSADPAEREERWLKIYRERRSKLLCL